MTTNDAPNTTVDCALCTGRGLPTHDRCDRPCPLCGGTGSYRVYVPPPGTPYSPKTTHHDAFFEED